MQICCNGSNKAKKISFYMFYMFRYKKVHTKINQYQKIYIFIYKKKLAKKVLIMKFLNYLCHKYI